MGRVARKGYRGAGGEQGGGASSPSKSSFVSVATWSLPRGTCPPWVRAAWMALCPPAPSTVTFYVMVTLLPGDVVLGRVESIAMGNTPPSQPAIMAVRCPSSASTAPRMSTLTATRSRWSPPPFVRPPVATMRKRPWPHAGRTITATAPRGGARGDRRWSCCRGPAGLSRSPSRADAPGKVVEAARSSLGDPFPRQPHAAAVCPQTRQPVAGLGAKKPRHHPPSAVAPANDGGGGRVTSGCRAARSRLRGRSPPPHVQSAAATSVAAVLSVIRWSTGDGPPAVVAASGGGGALGRVSEIRPSSRRRGGGGGRRRRGRVRRRGGGVGR